MQHRTNPLSIQNMLQSDEPKQPRPYQPKRISPPQSVLIPISRVELAQCQSSANPLRLKPKKNVSPLPPLETSPDSREDAFRSKKRSAIATPEPKEPAKKSRYQEDVAAVALHYNARPQVDREARRESPIYGLKNFNNWVKSVLIAKFGRHPGQRVRVLDLGCGKGGDLQKWAKAGVEEYIGIDLAMVSVEQARSRWEQGIRGNRRNSFPASFFVLDCFENPISEVLDATFVQRPFDIVSMQFCMHYAFESEAKARMMLHNVTSFLKPGGYFIGTIPDSQNLLARLEEIPEEDNKNLSWGNDVYTIKFDQRLSPSPFGHRYTFFLQDAVEDVPEYVVEWDMFVELASEFDLEIVFHADFQEIFVNERTDPDFEKLLTNMRVIDMNGETEMSIDQWEAASKFKLIFFLYFCHQKIDSIHYLAQTFTQALLSSRNILRNLHAYSRTYWTTSMRITAIANYLMKRIKTVLGRMEYMMTTLMRRKNGKNSSVTLAEAHLIEQAFNFNLFIKQMVQSCGRA